MTTFLELCTKLAEDSGGSGSAPTSVVGQIGRHKKIVGWVRDAWVSIQNLNPHWLFLRAEFQGTLSVGVNTYTSGSFGLTRFGAWAGGRTVTLYDTTIGVDDEGHLRQVPFDDWDRRWNVRSHDANRPTEYTLAPDGSVRVGATPDAAYAIRGEYVKSPQVLAVNGDVPDVPARFHEIIKWRAMMLMSQHDEAIAALQMATNEYRELLTSLERDQLPILNARAGRALA